VVGTPACVAVAGLTERRLPWGGVFAGIASLAAILALSRRLQKEKAA
jgi:hypothetical protein